MNKKFILVLLTLGLFASCSKNSQELYDQGEVHLLAEENYEAMECFKQSFDKDKTNSKALMKLAETERLGFLYDASMGHLNQAEEIGVDKAEVLKEKVIIWVAQGEKDNLLAGYVELAELTNDNNYFKLAGEEYLIKGLKDKAFECFNKVLELGGTLNDDQKMFVKVMSVNDSDFMSFTNEKYLFSIKYPSVWKTDTKEGENSFFFTSIGNSDKIGFSKNYNISIGPDQGAKINDWAKTIKYEFTKDNIEIVVSDVRKVNGFDCVYHKVRPVTGDQTVISTNYLFLKNNYMYSLFFFCPENEYEEFKITEQVIVNSLLIK